MLGEATVAALSTGEGSLSDYEGLQQVGKGRFSTVFYAQDKVGAAGVRGRRLTARDGGVCAGRSGKVRAAPGGSRGFVVVPKRAWWFWGGGGTSVPSGCVHAQVRAGSPPMVGSVSRAPRYACKWGYVPACRASEERRRGSWGPTSEGPDRPLCKELLSVQQGMRPHWVLVLRIRGIGRLCSRAFSCLWSLVLGLLHHLSPDDHAMPLLTLERYMQRRVTGLSGEHFVGVSIGWRCLFSLGRWASRDSRHPSGVVALSFRPGSAVLATFSFFFACLMFPSPWRGTPPHVHVGTPPRKLGSALLRWLRESPQPTSHNSLRNLGGMTPSSLVLPRGRLPDPFFVEASRRAPGRKP